MRRLLSAGFGWGLLVAWAGAASELSWQPLAGANGGFGSSFATVYDYFHVAQPIRVSAYCYLEVATYDQAPVVLQLWQDDGQHTPEHLTALGDPVVLGLASGTDFGDFTLAGSGYGGHLHGENVTPVVLPAGDYAMSAQVLPNTNGLSHWYFNTEEFAGGTGITVITPNGVGAVAATIGPAFAYEVLPPPLVLRYATVGNEIKLVWPASVTNAVLQITTALGDPTGWRDVAAVPVVSGTNQVLSLPMMNLVGGFRLRE
jgi:hypothetical protein